MRAISILGCLWVALFALPAAAAPMTIPLKPYVARLVTVDAIIDGKPAHLLLDTGGGISSITPQFAASIGCVPRGRIAAFRMSGERVGFGKCGRRGFSLGGYATPMDLAVYDLSAVLPPELPPLDGVLSLDAFVGRAITVDLSGRVIVVETPRSLARTIAGASEGAMRLQREAGGAGLSVFIRARAEAGDIWLLADSGNLAEIQLSRGALEQFAPHAQSPDASFTFRLAVDGLPAADSSAEVKDLIYDGALNERFFAAHRITFDLQRSRIWFAPAR